MPNRLWSTDGLFVGAATLLTMVSTALAKPADMKAILINGGTASLSAVGLVTWVRQRSNQTQLILRQEMQSYLRDAVKTARMLQAEEVNQTILTLRQKLTSFEKFPTELNQVKHQLNIESQKTRKLNRVWEQEFATLLALEEQVQALHDWVSQQTSNQVLAIPTAQANSERNQLIEPKPEAAVIQWLEQRQMRVAPPPPLIQPVDQHYNELALYLGNHYAALKDLHVCIKRALKNPDEKKRHHLLFHSSRISATDFRICAKFCQKLERAFFIEGDFYPKPGKRFLRGQLAEDTELRSFIDGKWFERFVYQKMTQILTDKRLNHACLLNATILAPDTNQIEAELDMVFLVAGHPIFIECKSGQYQQEDARKFTQYAEKLELAKPCAIFVVLESQAADIELQKPRMTTITMITSAQLLSALEDFLHFIEASALEISESDLVALEISESDLVAPEISESDLVAEPEVGTEKPTKGLNPLKHRPIKFSSCSGVAGLNRAV